MKKTAKRKSSHLKRSLIGGVSLGFIVGAGWMFVTLTLSNVNLLCSSVFAPVSLVAVLYWITEVLAPSVEKNILIEQMALKHRQQVAVQDTLKGLEELGKKKGRIQ